MNVELREIEKIKLDAPTIIEGFPGVGMIGTISASHLAEKLDMELTGYFASPRFPPIAAIHNYKPVSPARIYASEEHNIIVLFSEFVVPSEIVFALSQSIIDYAKAKKAKAIYSLAGVASPQPDGKTYGIASTPAMSEFLKKNGIDMIKEGATQGVSGVLIAECANEKYPAANLMVQTSAPFDPKASAKLLDKLGGMAGFDPQTKELLTQGEAIEVKIRDALDKMKSMHNDYKSMEENPMYG